MEPLTQLRCRDLVDISRALADSIDAHATGLDALAGEAGPDPLAGSVLSAAATAMVAAIDEAPTMVAPVHWGDAVRHGATADATAGAAAALGSFLSAMASVVASRESVDATTLGLAFEAGAESLPSGTAVADVAGAAAAAALGAVDVGGDLAGVAVAAADAALDALEARTIDAAGAGLCILFDVVVAHVHGDTLDVIGVDDEAVRAEARVDDPLYTLSCIVEIDPSAAPRLDRALGSLAPGVEVSTVAGVVSVSAGVDDLGTFIEMLCSFGRPRRLIIEDRRSRG